MKHSAPLLLLVVLQVGGLALAAIGAVTEDEAAQIALQTVKRAAGSAARITERDLGQRSWTFTVDDRWWVCVVPATGSVPIMADLDLRESEDPEARWMLRSALPRSRLQHWSSCARSSLASTWRSSC